MGDIKALLVPATFAYVGVRASAMIGVTSAIGQIAAGIAGAAAGLWLAKKV
jgi:hypothetical protein